MNDEDTAAPSRFNANSRVRVTAMMLSMAIAEAPAKVDIAQLPLLSSALVHRPSSPHIHSRPLNDVLARYVRPVFSWIPSPDMSRAAYVDTNLLGSGKVSKAAILGQQGGVWASSTGYNVRRVQLIFPVLESDFSTRSSFLVVR